MKILILILNKLIEVQFLNMNISNTRSPTKMKLLSYNLIDFHTSYLLILFT